MVALFVRLCEERVFYLLLNWAVAEIRSRDSTELDQWEAVLCVIRWESQTNLALRDVSSHQTEGMLSSDQYFCLYHTSEYIS